MFSGAVFQQDRAKKNPPLHAAKLDCMACVSGEFAAVAAVAFHLFIAPACFH
ncbi:MAG: hypothetical protein N2C14_33395 [Planctomycetales bacterium]